MNHSVAEKIKETEELGCLPEVNHKNEKKIKEK
jgi:hypothetical protein